MKNARNLLVCKFRNLSKSETGPHICRQGETAERQTTTDWEVADLMSKGIYLTGLPCVAAR